MWKPRRRGPRRLLLVLALLYALLLLIPAAVFTLSHQGRQEDPEGEPSPLSSPSPAPGQGPASQAAAQPEPPGFLEGLSLEPGGAQSPLFTLYDQATGQVLTLGEEEFLPGALACEMDPSAPQEALKAQAVAIYTLYTGKRGSGEAPQGADFSCDTANWQVYTTQDAMAQRWGDAFQENYALLREAAEAVRGQLLTWEGEPALTPYFAISAGATETPDHVWSPQADLPYLQAVASPGDAFSDGYQSSLTLTQEEFRQAAEAAFPQDPPDLSGPPEEWLEILEATPSGYVARALLGGREVTGTQLRSAFGLRSAAFTLSWENGTCTFTVRGWGHGVGMSQAGASFLVGQGKTYREILACYYPGTQLSGA